MKLIKSQYLQIKDYKVRKFTVQIKPSKDSGIDYPAEIDIQPLSIQKNTDGDASFFTGTFKTVISMFGKQGAKKTQDIKIESITEWSSDAKTEEDFVERVWMSGGPHILSLARNLVMSATGQMGIKPIFIPLVDLRASKEQHKEENRA